MSFLPLCFAVLLATASTTPLDDYVNAPDPTYEYQDLGDTSRADGCTSYLLNLTSQMWLTREFYESMVGMTPIKNGDLYIRY